MQQEKYMQFIITNQIVYKKHIIQPQFIEADVVFRSVKADSLIFISLTQQNMKTRTIYEYEHLHALIFF
jgi:hypothetical protein